MFTAEVGKVGSISARLFDKREDIVDQVNDEDKHDSRESKDHDGAVCVRSQQCSNVRCGKAVVCKWYDNWPIGAEGCSIEEIRHRF